MSPFAVSTEQKGAIVRIDLNRPETGNKLTREMMRGLAAVVTDHGSAPDTKAIVIEGRGGAFCAGRDGAGESYKDLPPHRVRHEAMGAVLGVYDALRNVPVPVIAMVHARAVGFGAALAGAADITLASSEATFSFPEIRHGIPPTMAMAAVLRNVPPKALLYLIYSAAEVEAAEAVQLGLASKVFEAASFKTDADAFVNELASRPRLNLETIKTFHNHSRGLSAEATAEYAGTLLALVRAG